MFVIDDAEMERRECTERLESEWRRDGIRMSVGPASTVMSAGGLEGPAREVGVLGLGSRSPTDPMLEANDEGPGMEEEKGGQSELS